VEEPGIAGLLVRLRPAAGQGLQPHAERTTITDAYGAYRFTNVVPGSHQLRIEDPSGYWLITPIEVQVSAELHQTVTVNVGISGLTLRLYLPLITSSR
jgi:protocatechuate 3,4-dioxygenase beta subunit